MSEYVIVDRKKITKDEFYKNLSISEAKRFAYDVRN